MSLQQKRPGDTTDHQANDENVHAVAGIELFHSIQDPILVVTPDGTIIDVNSATLQAAGKKRSAVIGKGVCQIIHGGRWPHITCPLEEFLLTCRGKSEDTKLPGLGGDYHLTISPLAGGNGEVHSILLLARRLTQEESRKVESLRTAQLAAVGELAAGVAHEVNNPINGIINYAQLILDDIGMDSLHGELLQRIVSEGERIATIIESLLSFARESENEFSGVDLRRVVRECLSLIDHQLKKEGVVVELDFAEADCLVTGNFMQLQQVVLNTINNSRYALNERYPEGSADKKIIISCRPAQGNKDAAMRLVIRDFGTGIPQGILDKLFDPFFTSKPKGKGTGLGLSISFGIIQNHGGSLSIDSVLHRYTDIIIELPGVAAPAEDEDV
jgi:PAS domain S-box-containing protein